MARHPNYGFVRAFLFVLDVRVVGTWHLARPSLGCCFDESPVVVSVQEEEVLLLLLLSRDWVKDGMTNDICQWDLDFEVVPVGEISHA